MFFMIFKLHKMLPNFAKSCGSIAQKMKFFTKNFFSKCEQIRRKVRIWSHSLKKFLTENFIFCAVELFVITGQYFEDS